MLVVSPSLVPRVVRVSFSLHGDLEPATGRPTGWLIPSSHRTACGWQCWICPDRLPPGEDPPQSAFPTASWDLLWGVPNSFRIAPGSCGAPLRCVVIHSRSQTVGTGMSDDSSLYPLGHPKAGQTSSVERRSMNMATRTNRGASWDGSIRTKSSKQRIGLSKLHGTDAIESMENGPAVEVPSGYFWLAVVSTNR